MTGKIYVMFCAQYFYRAKIGITNDSFSSRKAGIESTIKQETGVKPNIYGFALPTLFARKKEKYLHGKFSKFRTRVHGSGKTEWFWYVNILTTLAVFLLSKNIGEDKPPASFLWILLLPIPLDYMLIAVLAFLAELAIIALTLYAVIAALPIIINLIYG